MSAVGEVYIINAHDLRRDTPLYRCAVAHLPIGIHAPGPKAAIGSYGNRMVVADTYGFHIVHGFCAEIQWDICCTIAQLVVVVKPPSAEFSIVCDSERVG
jgi:hypothetical protein